MKIRVLLVDDEHEFLDVLAERLQNRGFSVSKALTGDQALERIMREDIDVAVVDVLMPGRDGIEILKEIKAARPLVEVIMFTGNATVQTAVEGMKLGAYDYLMKPTESKELIEKIVKAFIRKSDHEQRIRNAEIQRLLVAGAEE